jgi:hypothetical protein
MGVQKNKKTKRKIPECLAKRRCRFIAPHTICFAAGVHLEEDRETFSALDTMASHAISYYVIWAFAHEGPEPPNEKTFAFRFASGAFPPKNHPEQPGK